MKIGCGFMDRPEGVTSIRLTRQGVYAYNSLTFLCYALINTP